MSHTHSKQIIPAPGLEAMLASLGAGESGHPGEGWWSAAELAKTSGLHVTSVRTRCDKLVELGTYEECRRKIGCNHTTFYRLKKSGARQVFDKGNHENNPVRSSPPTRIPPSRGKRAGK